MMMLNPFPPSWHRDVKPHDILMDAAKKDDEEDGVEGEGEAAPCTRLADFESTAWGLMGTPHYVAPEVVSGGEYSTKADVWSAGAVMYALLSDGALPFSGKSAAEVPAVVMRGSVRFLPRLFGGVSPAAKDLMRRMIYRDEWRRFTAEQVLDE
ncbi:hypothetical protein SETIT_1G085000v2 [Setaria italica]|uniref:Protein kinase domain-containing protein n=1 Tax=Setaria italica TaxID=4555 RepID=K3YY56_SETIT|nr:hypothetical protein SETIT_1G085000v2 [Setaria italica]